MRVFLLALSLMCFCVCFLFSQNWSEKIISELTLDEKIGQLFIVPACPMRGNDHKEDWFNLLERFHIGGAIVKQSDPIAQVKCLNSLQQKSKIPLMVVADAEWGLAMRMRETMAFPRNRTLGAIDDLELIFKTGIEIGRQAKRVGIHMNLAPVADVNSNSANPIIGMRSFGEEPLHVAKCVEAMISGIQTAGILACAKHFPGHGDTSIDSHRALPVILHSRERLDKVEFLPFISAIEAGAAAMMSAHLLVPCIDPDQPATLSSACLTGVLKTDLGFQGLIISDALNMRALTQTPEEIAVQAFQAGCECLLYGDHLAPNIDKIIRDDIPRAWIALKKGFLDGTLSQDKLNAAVLKILATKERLELHVSTQVQEEGLSEDLHSPEAIQLKKQLFREAICLLGELRPLPKKTAYVKVGGPDCIADNFQSIYSVSPKLDKTSRIHLMHQLQDFDAMVIAIHEVDSRDKRYGFSSEFIRFIRDLPNSVLCFFCTPYAMDLFSDKRPILIAFENDAEAQFAVLDILLGRSDAKGHLNH